MAQEKGPLQRCPKGSNGASGPTLIKAFDPISLLIVDHDIELQFMKKKRPSSVLLASKAASVKDPSTVTLPPSEC